MENKVDLKTVKEYFKNAKEVRCLEGEVIDLTLDIYNERGIHEYDKCFYICLKRIKNYTLADEKGKFAEIISYKENPIQHDDFNEYTKDIIVNDAEIVTTKENGLRYNENKERWSLVDFEALKPMVKVLEFGAKKYDDHNWKKGLKTTEVSESLLRHLTDFLNGENNDKESGLSHIGHILCNAMFLSYMMQNKPEFDTRYKKPCCGNWNDNGTCKCK